MKELNQFSTQMKTMKYMQHDEIINMIGGSFGRFQMLAYVMCLILFSTEGFLIYNLAYLNLEPKYMCVNEKGVAHHCNRLETCLPQFNNDYS